MKKCRKKLPGKKLASEPKIRTQKFRPGTGMIHPTFRMIHPGTSMISTFFILPNCSSLYHGLAEGGRRQERFAWYWFYFSTIDINADRTIAQPTENQQRQRIDGLLHAADKAHECEHRLGVWNFLLRHEWIPSQAHHTPGTTWLELLFLYVLEGGTLPSGCDKERTVLSIRRVLAEFKLLVRSLVSIGLKSSDQELFAPARAREYALEHFGHRVICAIYPCQDCRGGGTA